MLTPPSPHRPHDKFPSFIQLYSVREGQNILLSLLSFDSQEGGLYHGTARIACAIIAGNRWDRYLSLQPNGPRIPETDQDILLSDKYYFLVPRELSQLHAPAASKGSIFVLILGHSRPLSLQSPGF